MQSQYCQVSRGPRVEREYHGYQLGQLERIFKDKIKKPVSVGGRRSNNDRVGGNRDSTGNRCEKKGTIEEMLVDVHPNEMLRPSENQCHSKRFKRKNQQSVVLKELCNHIGT